MQTSQAGNEMMHYGNYDEDRNVYIEGLCSCSLVTHTPFGDKEMSVMAQNWNAGHVHRLRDFGSLQFFIEHKLATSFQFWYL